MTIATMDHRDLHPRGRDHYKRPTFSGYPQEGDEVRAVYRSKRTGDLTERVGTVRRIIDEGGYGGGTSHPSYLELKIDDGRDRDLWVWGGGGYGPDDAETEGYAPAQVWTHGLVRNGHGGRSWRTNALGRLVRLDAPKGVTFEVTVSHVPIDRLEGIEDRLVTAVYDRFKRDRNGQDLLEVDVSRLGRLDREGDL